MLSVSLICRLSTSVTKRRLIQSLSIFQRNKSTQVILHFNNFERTVLSMKNSLPTSLKVNALYHRQNIHDRQFRHFSSEDATAAATGGNEGEMKIKSLLLKAFPSAKQVKVEDISGGCGSMFQVYIEANEFKGLSIVKQHQLVNKALQDEIKVMHGIRIETQVPK